MGLLAFLVLLFVIYLAVISPGFRYFLLLGIGAIALFVWSWSVQEERRMKRARSLIPHAQIEILDARLEMATFGKFTARVTNKSRHALNALSLRISIEDCSPNGKQCSVVGEDTVSDYLDVPPGQTRAMDAFATFRNLPQLRRPRWYYRIETVEAATR